MTTPTDPTTLRTALVEALVRLVEPRWGMFPGDWACVECVPTSDILRDGFLCGYHAARAALATPAPAADDARTRPHEPECPGGYTGWECFCGAAPTPAPAADECEVFIASDGLPALRKRTPAADEARPWHEYIPMSSKRMGSPCQRCGQNSFHDNHQPAPTPAPPTPPATEGWYHGDLTDAQIDRMLDPRTPATEPVAALVEKLMWTLNALVDETWEQDDVEEVSRYLTAIVAAARAEVDVERYIPGYRVTFAEFDRACQYLRDVGGWSGLVPFDEAIKAMAEPDADDR